VADATALVFRHELRASLRTWLVWVVPVGAMVAMTSALQPSLAAGPLAAKLDSMPDLLRKAFGLEVVDFHRPAAYLATNFTTVSLSAALFAGLLGAAMIAKEEVLHTAEVLFAQPTSRTRILLGKLGALVVYTLAFPLVLAVIAMVVLGIVADRPLEPLAIAELFLGATAIALCFAGLGMLVAALVSDKRSAGGAALGVVLGTYFLGILSAIAEPAAPLGWLSPHELAKAPHILMHGLDPLRVTLLVALGAGSATLAFAFYRRRDIHA
jgi:ABC-2 type transport system permease protein